MLSRILAVLAAVVMLATFTVAKEQGSAPVAATLGEDGVQRLAMEGGEYYFKPDNVVLKVAVPVELFVRKARGFVPHNIVMDSQESAMSFKEDFDSKGTTIRFTPSATGTFEFWCDKKFLFFKSHREKGMKGVFQVIN